MNKKDLNATDLINAQNRANQKAKKLIRILGLDDMIVRQNKVIHISSDGSEQVVKEIQHKTVKAQKGTFTLKN